MISDLILQLRDNRDTWEPGETLTGTVSLRHDAEWTARHFTLTVWWNTEGKGTMDKGIVHRQEFAAKGTRMPARVEQDFRVQLPPLPWSYHGRLVKIHWWIGVHARALGSAEQSVMIPLRVFPGASGEARPSLASLIPDAPPED